MIELPDIPLIVNQDAYCVEVIDDNVSIVVHQIFVFPNNENVRPVKRRWYELQQNEKDAVLKQIRRRYPKRMVRIDCV